MKVSLASEEFVGMKVEKKPPARGWQGSAKEDWVTEWFWERISLCTVRGEKTGEGMYLGEERELDRVADVGFDIVGHECEGTTVADLHGDGGGSLCERSRGSGEESR